LIPLSLAAVTTWGNASFAQASAANPDLPAPATQAATYDPQQLPSIRGEIERMSLTARGDIDGVILKDGTEVKISPELSTQIAFAIKPGDRVTIHGLRAAALPLVRAVSIADDVTHRTVTERGSDSVNPAPPPRPEPRLRGAPPPPPGAAPWVQGGGSEMSGRVRMALHGPQGEVNGVLLDNGVILRFPPDRAAQLAALIQPRQSLVADGITVTNSLGTVMDVQQLGPSRDRLVAVGPPSPPRR
jgi:hypothetical protein